MLVAGQYLFVLIVMFANNSKVSNDSMLIILGEGVIVILINCKILEFTLTYRQFLEISRAVDIHMIQDLLVVEVGRQIAL